MGLLGCVTVAALVLLSFTDGLVRVGLAVVMAAALLATLYLALGSSGYLGAATAVVAITTIAFGLLTVLPGGSKRDPEPEAGCKPGETIAPEANADLSRWQQFGNGTASYGANLLQIALEPGDYNSAGWALDGVGYCDYRLTFTVDLKTPPLALPKSPISNLGWGFGVGTCMAIGQNGEPMGAYLQYGFIESPGEPQRVLAGIVKSGEYNTYTFINDTPARVPRPYVAGELIEIAWTIEVHGPTASATGTVGGVPGPHVKWPLADGPRLPAACGVDGGNGVAFRVWGTEAVIRSPMITSL
ncbi:hypothetical protein [Frankia sp. Cr1]|uniref:hypothetical protein n=1 Tax=Frankia sp. Cr1 TaxID=3073931 RepID=UPI002AD2DCA8|nr:hypothetical protein [Frankia sp. Cr1]